MLPAPNPTPNLVLSSYFALAIAHGVEAKFLKLRFTGAPWINIIGVVSAIYYALAIRFGLIHFGWHHMIEGLIFWLIPLSIMRVFGLAYVLDELFYYNEILILPWNPVSGGVDDFVDKNKVFWITVLVAATLTEIFMRIAFFRRR